MTDSNFALANLPITESSTSLQDTTQTTIGSIARGLVADDNIWAEFLKLQISEHTKRTYASALNDFFVRMTGVKVNPHQIREFLNLPSAQAIAVVLSYRARLLDLNLKKFLSINHRMQILAAQY